MYYFNVFNRRDTIYRRNIAIAVGLLTLVSFLTLWKLQETTRGTSVTSVAIGTAGVMAFFIAALVCLFPSPGMKWAQLGSKDPIQDSLDKLSEKVLNDWRSEAIAMGLLEPRPINVSWEYQSDLSTIGAGALGIDSGVIVKELRAHGSISSLVDGWDRLGTPRRAVILGNPGSGKSSAAILFLCEILTRRNIGDPVPVIFSLVKWDPSSEHTLKDWIADQLELEYSEFLAGDSSSGGRIAQTLVEDCRILPILDGFDEIIADKQIEALRKINNALSGAEWEILLTSRTAEYEKAIKSSTCPVTNSTVIRLLPLKSDQVVHYLRDGNIGNRLGPVIEEVQRNRGGALAEVLSNPLIVFLCRSVYREPGTDSTELTHLDNRMAIESHLLKEYIPTRYRRFKEKLPSGQKTIMSADEAIVLLTLLAKSLADRTEISIGGWRIKSKNPYGRKDLIRKMKMIMAFYMVVAAPLVAIWYSVRYNLTFGLVMGGFTELISVVGFVGAGRQAGRKRTDPDRRYRAVVRRSRETWVSKSGLEMEQMISESRQLRRMSIPRVPIVFIRRSAYAILGVGSAFVFIAWLSGRFSNSQILAMPLIPISVWAFALYCILLFNSSHLLWRTQFVRALFEGTSKQFPIRYIEFLEDAHRRSILRKTGSLYQFRHARLQDILLEAPKE